MDPVFATRTTQLKTARRLFIKFRQFPGLSMKNDIPSIFCSFPQGYKYFQSFFFFFFFGQKKFLFAPCLWMKFSLTLFRRAFWGFLWSGRGGGGPTTLLRLNPHRIIHAWILITVHYGYNEMIRAQNTVIHFITWIPACFVGVSITFECMVEFLGLKKKYI